MSIEPEKIITISKLNKVYDSGFKALQDISFEINKGEIFALLGPNGAGKTTLISIICGLVNPSSGTVSVGGKDIIKDFRHTRSLIGLVPQELTTDAFETVLNTVNFSRGLFGKPKNPEYIESILKSLSLWDKKDSKLMTLSGGMKRRVLIAKALSHEPKVLFLDEPTAGVDVELRKQMWQVVHDLRQTGVTIILTTHYIEEAEEMADRVGVIQNGKLILVKNKVDIMNKLGQKTLTLELEKPIDKLPEKLTAFNLEKIEQGKALKFTYDTKSSQNQISQIFDILRENNIPFKDLKTKNSSLEEIFVQLVSKS